MSYQGNNRNNFNRNNNNGGAARSYSAFNDSDLALYAAMINGSDRPAKGFLKGTNVVKGGFSWTIYPNHTTHRESVYIALPDLAVSKIIEHVKFLAEHPESEESTKAALMRPAKGGQPAPQGIEYKVYRDKDGIICLTFRSTSSKFPTFPFQFLYEGGMVQNIDENGDARLTSCKRAIEWVNCISDYVAAFRAMVLQNALATAKDNAGQQGGNRAGGQGNAGGNNYGGNNGGNGGAGSYDNSGDDFQFDEDVEF